MQHLMFAHLLVGLAVLGAAGPVAKVAEALAPSTESKHVVEVPAKTTVKLPTPHGHRGGPCEKAAAPAEQKVTLSKHHVPVPPKTDVKLPTPHAHPEAASKEAGKDAVPSDHKVAQSKHHTPVPPKPDVNLPTPYGHPEAGSQSKHHVPVPPKTSVKLPIPHGHPEAGLVQASEKDAPVQSKVTLSRHHVPVPPKTDVKLPMPHGHPEAGAVKMSGEAGEPISCSKLDACLAEAGAEDQDKHKSASKFKACFQSFCAELYSDTALNKSDTRTSLCDAKGKDAWDILSKANLQAQAKLTAPQKTKPSLVALRSHLPDTYAAVLHVLFAQLPGVNHMSDRCRV